MVKDQLEAARGRANSVDYKARMERDGNLAVDIQAAHYKLRKAEENLKIVIKRLVDLAPNGGGRPDALGGVQRCISL